MAATIRIENPTEEQQKLMAEADTALALEQILASPIDPDFLPEGRIDQRRLVKLQRRMADEAAIYYAAMLTQLVATGASKVRR